MGAVAKHEYRTVFLKSEQWKDLRIACLARDKAKCVVCGKRDLSNDAHHIRYRRRWCETRVEDLRTLCRGCHKKVHEIMDQQGFSGWKKIRWEAFPVGHSHKVRGGDRAAAYACRNKFWLTSIIAWRMGMPRSTSAWLPVLLNRRVARVTVLQMIQRGMASRKFGQLQETQEGPDYFTLDGYESENI